MGKKSIFYLVHSALKRTGSNNDNIAFCICAFVTKFSSDFVCYRMLLYIYIEINIRPNEVNGRHINLHNSKHADFGLNFYQCSIYSTMFIVRRSMRSILRIRNHRIPGSIEKFEWKFYQFTPKLRYEHQLKDFRFLPRKQHKNGM